VDVEMPWAVVETVTVEPLARDTEWREHKVATQKIICSLAHEIKNPLGGLRGAAQLLGRQLVADDLQEYTKIIISEADHLTKLVDRMIAPRLPLSSEDFNLHEVLEHVRHFIEVEFGEEIEVRRDYDPSIPYATGQKEYLIQAILNIARNAVQAINGLGVIQFRTRVRRQITVGGRRHRQALEETISDNGPGIAKELQEKIFLPMITGRPGGAGLGLTLAQDIVDRQGGAIECTSLSGETRFTLLLPVDPIS
jgi:two-component system nitrogen regulation sensor histidine kinase GlnL